jgi:nitrogen fixation protein NifQ
MSCKAGVSDPKAIRMTLVEAWIAPTACFETTFSEDVGPPRRRLDYRSLTGVDRAQAEIAEDEDFDRHVLACILAVSERAEPAGLTDDQLSALTESCFPASRIHVGTWAPSPAPTEDEEVTMVRDLLLANRSSLGEVGHWLAAMIARRSMEPNHLWEDLGLRERSELTRLLERHFAPLAGRNTRNMRWKRFFYRMLCEDDGFVMCSTPVCTQCRDFDMCFGDESGESRMAERRREIALREMDPR